MKFNEIPKFVVNLERRPERLKSIQAEMEYIGWDYELFYAVDKNSHVGCSLSHIEIIKLAKERNYECVLIIEDDCSVMPYANSLLEKIEVEIENLDFGVINLAPTLNRPVLKHNTLNTLMDITTLPPCLPHHRDIFATNMILYHNSSLLFQKNKVIFQFYQSLLNLEDGLMYQMENIIIFMGKHIIGTYILHSKYMVSF
jgi:GR25 family glycosyltransferase involved in LPS biosynthesis